jgi:malonyl-CoA O-methyltransferase
MSTLIKERIKRNFTLAAATYDQHCLVQNVIAAQAVNLLCRHQKYFDIVADFACGTGESTRQLLGEIDYSHCYAIDFCEDLLMRAKSKYPDKASFILSDFEKTIFKKESLDLIFCNMGLQWSSQIDQVIKLFASYLRENGRFVFSLPLADNFPELKSRNKLSLLTHDAIVEILYNAGFELNDFINFQYQVNFKSYYAALKSLQYTGTNYAMSESKNRVGYSKRSLEDLFLIVNTNVSLTYRVGIYVAKTIA